MAPKPTCAHCNKKIWDKHFLTCSQCKRSYDLNCTNSEKLYDLMDRERKESWSCIKCRQCKAQLKRTSTPKITTKRSVANPPTSHQATIALSEKNSNKCCEPLPQSQQTQQQPEELQQSEVQSQPQSLQQEQQFNCSVDNITRRKYNVTVRNSFESFSDEEFDTSIQRNDTLNRSCPNLTINYKDEVEVLKNKIADLQEKLEFSDSYSTKLLMENDDLKKQITDYTRQIQQLKNICKATTTVVKPVTKAIKHQSAQTIIDYNNEGQHIMKRSNEMLDKCIKTPTPSINHNKKDNYYEPSMTQNCNHPAKRIHIFGGKQSRGLAGALLNSRQKTPYGKYEITATVKPDALCEDLLKSSQTLKAGYNDIFILQSDLP